jgi:hypothetical protein
MGKGDAEAITREWQWLKAAEEAPPPPLPGLSPAARSSAEDGNNTKDGYAVLVDMASVLFSALQEQARREKLAEDMRRRKEPRPVFGAVALARSPGVLAKICGIIASFKDGAKDMPGTVLLLACTCKEWRKALQDVVRMIWPIHLIQLAEVRASEAEAAAATAALLGQLHLQQQTQQQQQPLHTIAHNPAPHVQTATAHRPTPMAKLKQGLLGMRGGGDDSAKKGLSCWKEPSIVLQTRTLNVWTCM